MAAKKNTPLMPLRGRSIASWVLSVPESALALALAYAVMLATAWFGCRFMASHCIDLSGLPWYLGGGVLGLVVAAVFWYRAFRLDDQWRSRLLLDAVVLLLSVLPFVIAWASDRTAQSKPPVTRSPAPPPAIQPPVSR